MKTIAKSGYFNYGGQPISYSIIEENSKFEAAISYQDKVISNVFATDAGANKWIENELNLISKLGNVYEEIYD